MGWPIDMERKGCESIGCYTHFVTLNGHFTHDLDLGFFKVKFWKCCISGMGGKIDMEQKGFESTEFWTHVVTFHVHFFHDLDLGFSRSNFEKVNLRNGMADWHGTKGMWVDRMLDSHCDFKLWPHPWPWPWIFKVKYCNLGMGGSTHIKWKGCELDMMLDAQWDWPWVHDHGAWQIDQPSNGSVWNFYSFQPVGQWMGYSFTDLGAEGCCRSLNALSETDNTKPLPEPMLTYH